MHPSPRHTHFALLPLSTLFPCARSIPFPCALAWHPARISLSRAHWPPALPQSQTPCPALLHHRRSSSWLHAIHAISTIVCPHRLHAPPCKTRRHACELLTGPLAYNREQAAYRRGHSCSIVVYPRASHPVANVLTTTTNQIERN